MTQLPAVSLAAVPGRRSTILDIAKEIERLGDFPVSMGRVCLTILPCARRLHS